MKTKERERTTMYQLNLTEFTQAQFLKEYWQKKPVVIRQGFLNFQDPICADEIAGLAGEEQVESRLVYKKGEQWQAEFGPFDDFARLGDKDWSLIVQALDHWSEDAAKMIEPFRFIPHWRLDDLMVSFATPGGGVGPHIDLYDVFICQGSGKRQWRVGEKGEHREFAAHESLLHVDPFEPIIDVELLPGDILYIPPGFPHDGVTIENSLSFSVGFRTNSTNALFSGLADHLIDAEQGLELIADPERELSTESGAINASDYGLIKQQLQQFLDDDVKFSQFAGSFLSQAKHELDLLTPELPFTKEDVGFTIKENNLQKLGGLRAFYFSHSLNEGRCYIDGAEVLFAGEVAGAVKLMCDNVSLTPEQLLPWQDNDAFLSFLTEQINAGYWYFAQ